MSWITPALCRTRSRSGALRSGILALGAAALAACGGGPSDARSSAERAARLHRSAIVIDTHSDTTPRFEDPSWSFAEEHDPSDGTMDLPRIARGGLDAEFWSIYMGRTEGHGAAIAKAIHRIDAVHRMVARHRERTELATSAGDIRRIVAQGKLASLMGIEGGHIIEDDLAALRTYYRLGARYMTLTHSFNTDWADSSGTTEVPKPEHGGLTDFGREVVHEMNRLGMMVDVSHVSDGTFWDVIETTRAPVIASHSSCRAIADHPRNLSDDMLRALADNGGVVMINFYPVYIDEKAAVQARAIVARVHPLATRLRERLSGDPKALRAALRALYSKHPFPQTSLDVLLDHFDHALAVAGADHVGIGADWDGVPSLPVGMEDVSKLPALTAGLLARGHAPGTVLKVLGGNLLRTMRAVERAAETLGAQAEPRPRVPPAD